jgi:hypothetical protein
MSCSPVISNYLITKLLDVLTNQASYTSPTTVYLALYTSNPGVGNTGTEVSGGSYARQSITWSSVGSGQSASNTNTITFPTATGNWGTISYWALFDASTGGNLLMFTPTSISVAITTGQSYPNITSGQVVLAFQ